jgi:hypothetical protein
MFICNFGINAAISKRCLYSSLCIVLTAESRHFKMCSFVMGVRSCQTLYFFLDRDAVYFGI